MKINLLTTVLLALACTTNIMAQIPTLLKDFNPTGDTYISNFVTVKGKTIFIANDGVNGYELWITDGTTLGTEMLIDINPNPGESGVGAICPEAVKGKVYFGASSISPSAPGGADYELWVTDGTAIGTHVVKNTPGKTPGTLQPQQFKVAGNKVYYTFKDQIWVSNGTSSGTIMIEPSTGLSDAFRLFCTYNSKLLYYKYDLNDDSWDLYITDGTTGGGSLLLDGNTFATQPNIAPIELNGLLYFLFDDWIHHTELWVTDGTSGGTHIVKDIVTNVGSLTGNEFYSLTSYDGKLFFSADADGFDGNGFQPWVSDGTEAGTVLLKNMNCVGDFKVFNNQLYFGGNISLPGDFELCVSDGTEAGTTFFKDLNNDPNYSSIPSNYHVLGDKMYFTAKTSGAPFHIKLFETDGTPGNTFVTDPAVVQNPNSILSYGVGVSAGKLYITANYDETIGYETYVIIGEPKLKWTGNISTNWFDKRNWNNNEVPTKDTDIIIPSGKPRYPVITSGTPNCREMEIQTGASLTMTAGTIHVYGEITATDEIMFQLDGGTMILYHGSNFPNHMNFNNLTLIALNDDIADNTYQFDELTQVEGNLVLKGSPTGTAENVPTLKLAESQNLFLLKNLTINQGQIGMETSLLPLANNENIPKVHFFGTTSQTVKLYNRTTNLDAQSSGFLCNVAIRNPLVKFINTGRTIYCYNLSINENLDLAGNSFAVLGKILYRDDFGTSQKIANTKPWKGRLSIYNLSDCSNDNHLQWLSIDRLSFFSYSNVNTNDTIVLLQPLAADTVSVLGYLNLLGQDLTIGKKSSSAGRLECDLVVSTIAQGTLSLFGNNACPRYKLAADSINNLVLDNPSGVELNNHQLVETHPSYRRMNLFGTATLTKGNFDLKETQVFLVPDVLFNTTSGSIRETPGNTFTTSVLNSGSYLIKDTVVSTSSSEMNIGGLGFNITCSNPLNEFTLIRTPSSVNGLNSNSSINRAFIVSNPNGGVNLNAQIQLNYDDSELQGINESDLIIFRQSDNEPNGVWHSIPSTVNTTDNTVTANSGLSQIDYSTSGPSGATLYTLASSIAPLIGTDETPLNAASIPSQYYNADDSSTSFDEQEAMVTSISSNNLNQGQFELYPNITTNAINIRSTISGQQTILIYNMQGKLMYESTSNGTVSSVDVATYPAGTYVVMLYNENQRDIAKFVKVQE